MNNNIKKKSFIVLFLMLFMCIFSYNTVNAEAVTKDLGIKTNVSANYSWTVRFNRNVEKSTVNNKTIKVKDSLGKEVAVNLVSDGKTVKISPIKPYKYKEAYDINVENVKCVCGEDLSQKVHMRFIVKEDPSKEIKSINNINITVDKGQAYKLPTTVKAVFKDGSVKSVPVSWNPKNADTSTAGLHIYLGTVLGYSSKVKLNLNVKTNKPVICIDPGHGGSDSGAVGPNGIREKDITLKVGLKVGNILKQRGINVVYTRTTDKRLGPTETADLQKRCDITNNANAKYMISIHCNSFDASSAHGTETFYKPGDREGQRLAAAIQRHIVEDLGTYNRGIKDGSWLYIARHTSSTTVLTELGFISNPREENMLKSDSYQNRYANAIAKGVFEVLGM
ncbi:N-acetylmuramoyl-L-alanine amidase [Clostridium oceanicum]|uniref:MurNAc-LAA domain-containing protein n=1 Tax=Clostridium oceanicum TaxID=1543 RepID=A0ABN1JPH2_9CLOT